MSTNPPPEKPRSAERRRRSRSKALLMADVKDLSTGRSFTAVSKNLSGTGVCLVGDLPIERGHKLELEMELAGSGGPLVVVGEAVWIMTLRTTDVNHVEIGVRFLQLSPAMQSLLNKALQ